MTYNAIKIGLKIKQARKQKGLTQTELAAILGLKKAAISKYEKGQIKKIPFVIRAILVKVLDLNYQDLCLEQEYNKLLSVMKLESDNEI